MDPVGGVDLGQLAAPAAGLPGQVGDPQRVPPAVFGLEQGQLRAGVRALAAANMRIFAGHAIELIPAGAFAQQWR